MRSPSTRLFAVAGCAAGGAIAGEALAPGAGPAFAAGAACVVLLGLAAALRQPGAVLVAALLLGASLAGLRTASLERSVLAAGARASADATLEGRVLGRPALAGGALRFPFGVAHAVVDGAAVRVRERVLVSIRPPPDGVTWDTGDGLRVEARLAPLTPRDATPAARASALRARRAGVAARAYARPAGVRRTGGPSGALDVAGRAGRRAVTRAAASLPARERGLLAGITVGDTASLDARLAEDFRATGLTHLLAVSGGNVAMFLGAIALVLRRAGAGRRASVAVLAAALVVFASITRFEPSVLRAGLMASVGLAGTALGARRETLSALAVAAVVLIVWDPFIVHAIGFQLSALATLGLLTIGPRLRALARTKIGAAAAVSLAAQLAVTPLIAMAFHSVSLVSVAANVLVMPAVGPATVLGFAAAAAGSVWGVFGALVASAAWPLLAWMRLVATTLARVPHASIATPSGIAGGLVVAALAVLAAAALRMRRAPRFGAFVVVLGIAAAASVWSGALAPPPANGLEVIALDVGQGDAVLVRAPGGATMLVDGGPEPSVTMKRLAAHRVGRIDLMVLTHPHADHVNGLAALAQRAGVVRALDPRLDTDLGAYAEYQRALRDRRIPRDRARAGMRYALGPAVVEVLAPAEPLFAGTASDLNNNSVVLRVRYGASAALLAGELQEEGQLRLLREPASLRAQVFKVPHHGSARMVREFYEAIGARVALIPVGANDFGHPSARCMEALAAAGTRAFRTDLSGDVAVVLGPRGEIAVREGRPAAAAA